MKTRFVIFCVTTALRIFRSHRRSFLITTKVTFISRRICILNWKVGSLMRTKNKDQRNSRNRVHVFTCSCVHDRQESSRIKGQRSTANGQLPMFGCKLLAVSRRLFVMSLVFGLWSLVFGCSTFYGGTTSSEGEQNITAAPTEIQVMADVNTVGYRTITFTNQSKTDNYEITNMAFVDNDCGAYSLYNILDEAGNMLYQTGDDIAVSVVPGARVDINIRFSPLKCAVTQ